MKATSRFGLVAALHMLLNVSAARAQESSRIDCFLPSDALGCAQVESAMRSLDMGEASLTLRALPLSTCIEYVVSLRNGDEERVLRERFDRSLPDDVALTRIVALIERAVRRDPENVEEEATPTTGFYVEPSASIYYATASLYALSTLSGQLTLNYSSPALRVRTTGKVRHRHYSLPNGEERIEADFLDHSASTRMARSFDEHWSVGVLAEELSLPYQNQLLTFSTGAGVEWTQHSFLRTNDSNFALRYEARAQHYQLRGENLDGALALWTARHVAVGAWRMHGERVDIDLGLVGSALMTAPRYWDLSVNSVITLRILEGLRVSFEFAATFRGDVIQQSRMTSDLPNGYGLVGGGDFGATTIETTLALTYTLGDAALSASDQRWR